MRPLKDEAAMPLICWARATREELLREIIIRLGVARKRDFYESSSEL